MNDTQVEFIGVSLTGNEKVSKVIEVLGHLCKVKLRQLFIEQPKNSKWPLNDILGPGYLQNGIVI